MRKLATIIVFFIAPMLVRGQSDILLTQQIFCRMNMNPAATGASNYTNIFFLGRIQWVGIEGAPNTQYIDAHKYLPMYNSGAGISMVRDQIGLENTFNAKLNYAYHLRLNRKSYLSMGIAAGILYRSVSGARIYENPSSSFVSYNPDSEIFPDVDLGLEYSYKDLLLGVSTTHLFNKPLSSNILRSGRQFYGYAQYHIPIQQWKLSPATIFTTMENTFSMDAMLIGSYAEVAWGGVSVRFNEQIKATSVALLVGVWVFNDFQIGYSYDINTGQIARNAGSHELMLHWRFGSKTPMPARAPRFIDF